VRLYFDSSAIVKLVQAATETEALRRFIGLYPDDGLVTSALAHVEVLRGAARAGHVAVERARDELVKFDQLAIDVALLERAAVLLPSRRLRSLDAIHLASAELLGVELRAAVTYDQRMAEAAAALGLIVEAPAPG